MSEPQSVTIDASMVIKLPRGVRLHQDPVRKQMVMLAPERALALDEIAVIIVKALDGVRSLDQIASDFARDFDAPKDQVLADMIAFAQEFANRRMLEIVR
jgi:pyrroloquinoline quinone biosynthesis protein D